MREQADRVEEAFSRRVAETEEATRSLEAELKQVRYKWLFAKVGGLDSQDQSRLRSRMSFVSRITFLKCQDFLDGRDHLFFFSVKIFKIEIFQLRFIFVKIFIKIVKINRDCQDFLRFIKIS